MSAAEIVFLIVVLLAGAATLTLLFRTRGERKKKPPKPVRPAPVQVREVPGLMPEDSDDVTSLYHWEPEQWKVRCPWCDCENEDTALFCKACGRILLTEENHVL